ncbi:hypothetical protein GRZ55_11335 [Chelativorans sp. ZYF759]|uniref:hypothetical protein n=1 Tax=Chelativorans sp. ZYF759 TaxID=2692213 RepID=UPI00145EDA3B|nr:hypothetical protein [Chelativorans sp. ZYF759]NMG39837.1 hypothetical protein [Chelativorans sp. ZYF759]
MSSEACRYAPWGREKLVQQDIAPGVDPRPGIDLRLPETVWPLLILAAAHDGVSPAKLVEQLVCARCEMIGLSALYAEHDRALTSRHGNSRAHSCRGGDHG